jgi:hypothetical protein
MADDNNSTPQKGMSKKARQKLFLEAYAEHANVLLSAKAAHINRTTVYVWLEHDEDFSFAFNQAKEDAKDTLRAEIYRRGKEGWDEDIYQLGKFAGKVRKYDTTLLIFQAKALMPEYRDKQIEVNNTVNNYTERNQVYEKMNEGELDQLETLYRQAQERIQRGY